MLSQDATLNGSNHPLGRSLRGALTVIRNHRMLITFALLAFSIMMYFHARLLIPSSAVNVETVEVTFTTTQQVPPASDVSAVPDMDLGDGWQPMCSEQPAGDSEWDIKPCGSCPWTFTKEKPIVAASLLVYQKHELLARMLETLAETNTDGAQIVLFVFENQPGGPPRQVLEAQKHFPVVYVDRHPGDDPAGNMGIILPRIRIMQAIMAHGCRFQTFLEIHDDMSFFQPGWLSKLLTFDEPQVGILMPFIVLDTGGNDVATTQRAIALAEERMRGLDPEKSMLYYDCGAVHPWILKRSVLRTVGYYDSGYKVHEVEDNDFYHRIRVAGFHGLAIRSVWALHAGAATRGILPSVYGANLNRFMTKHGMSPADSYKKYFNQCGPLARLELLDSEMTYDPAVAPPPHE